jgi:Mrp family chromosome partitioning ATPase
MSRQEVSSRDAALKRIVADPRIRLALQPSEALATHFSSLAMQVREWTADQVGLIAIGVFGVSRGVGASTVAYNLAASLAQGLHEARVVLAEADWSSSFVLKSRALGLSEGILDRANLNECLLEMGLDGLKLLPRGSVTASEANQLPWSRLKECLKRDLSAFDLVVFDLPSLESMQLCQLVSSQLTGLIAVSAPEDPRNRQLSALRQKLQTSPVQFLGRIINKSVD